MDQNRDVLADHHKRIRALEAVKGAGSAAGRVSSYKVFSTDLMAVQTGQTGWSGGISARGWTPDVAGVPQYVGGNVSRISGGNVYIDTWTNSYDNGDPQWMPQGYNGAWWGGWTRNQRIIRNRWVPGATQPGPQTARTVWIETRDGNTAVKIADINDPPVSSISGGGAYRANGFPVESTTPNSEGRVLIYGGGATTDEFYMYDPALGTTLLWATMAQTCDPVTQAAWLQNPITNRNRHGLGLMVMQEMNNTISNELFDYTGGVAKVLDASGGGMIDWIGRFSPDGKWLAYAGFIGGNPELWLVNLDTLTETRLDIEVGIRVDMFDWSPASDYVVMTNQNLDVYLVSVPDGYPQMIADSVGGAFSNPQWRGHSIVATYEEPTYTQAAAIVELKPRDRTWVVLDDFGTAAGYPSDPAGQGRGIAISPGGRFVMYAKSDHVSGGYDICDVWVRETLGLAG